jgi:hypothetical protein
MFIDESFLSFIWQFQQFNTRNLTDADQVPISIISPGSRNYDQGPDFLNATVKAGQVTWHGNIEIHIKASDWNDHRHSRDQGYDNVILHVVWENDITVFRSDGTLIPSLELKHIVDSGLINRFHQLVNRTDSVPCAPEAGNVRTIVKSTMLQNTLVERLKAKSEYALEMLPLCQDDWEELSYRLLMRNYGFKINQHPMLALATYMPYKILKKHAGNLFQIESLLFGTAGFLKPKPADEYHRSLKAEYDFLSKKYTLANGFLTRHQWKFMRTYPSNFPTVRIGQVSSFINHGGSIFNLVMHPGPVKEMITLFKPQPGGYWEDHYDFAKKSGRKIQMGRESLYGLLINSILPLLGAYGIYADEPGYFDRALDMMEEIPAEKNRIVRRFESLGFPHAHASDSQALIHLYNNFCIKKKCLNCKIGVNILYPDDRISSH